MIVFIQCDSFPLMTYKHPRVTDERRTCENSWICLLSRPQNFLICSFISYILTNWIYFPCCFCWHFITVQYLPCNYKCSFPFWEGQDSGSFVTSRFTDELPAIKTTWTVVWYGVCESFVIVCSLDAKGRLKVSRIWTFQNTQMKLKVIANWKLK